MYIYTKNGVHCKIHAQHLLSTDGEVDPEIWKPEMKMEGEEFEEESEMI